MSDPFSRIMKMDGEAELTPVDGNDPFAHMTGTTAPLNSPGSFDIDFNQPKADVRRQIAKLPKSQRKAAMKQWADVFVAKERKDGGALQDANDVVRNLSRGTVVGSFLDEANAYTAAAQNALGLGGAPYDEAVAYQRALDRAQDKDSTVIGKLPVIGDVTAGGVTKLAGGILSAPATPVVRAMQGAAMLPRIANAAATGGLYGLIYGAGTGEDAESRGMNAAIGGAGGAVAGAALPVITTGIARGATGVANAAGRVVRGRPTPNALRQHHPQAVRKVQRALNDDFSTVGGHSSSGRELQQRSRMLGERGALMDMGPNLSDQAGAIASNPGRGKSIINTMLRNRARGSQGRINDATNAALGNPVNVPASRQATLDAANETARPLYDRFYQTTVPINRRMRSFLNRAQSIGADRRAAALMEAEGIDPATVSNNGRFFDYLKRAVDDMTGTAQRQGERNLVRIYSSISRGIREEVDTALSPSDPTRSVWAIARRAAGDGLQFEEGLEQGAKAFSRGKTPDQMRAELADASATQRTGYGIGARDQIRQTMGNASTKFGENASAKGRSLLGSGNAREKLNIIEQNAGRTVAGQQRGGGRELIRTLDREAEFDKAYTSVLQNSKTASRQAAQREFPGAVDSTEVANQLGRKTTTGLTLEAGYRVLNNLLDGHLDARRALIQEHAADLLTMQGARRDQVIRILMDRTQRQNTTEAQRTFLQGLIESIARGAQPTATGNVLE